jgi:hypothetical protein
MLYRRKLRHNRDCGFAAGWSYVILEASVGAAKPNAKTLCAGSVLKCVVFDLRF